MCAWTASTKDEEEPPTSKGAFASAAFGRVARVVFTASVPFHLIEGSRNCLRPARRLLPDVRRRQRVIGDHLDPKFTLAGLAVFFIDFY